ncbi:MAG: hypothetical protein QM726_10775 [Chitinophagaceae bacterium]
MTRFLLSLIFCAALLMGVGHNKKAKSSPETLDNCSDRWQYLSSQDTMRGQVLFHAKATVACGILASASLTIIKTAKDTVRILELCNDRKDFKQWSMVKVIPAKQPGFSVVFRGNDLPFACSVQKTYYGTVRNF